MSRSLCTSPLRALPARINPKSKLMEVINADGSVTHAINQMLAYVWRKVIPALNPEELAAKHDSSQFIAESQKRLLPQIVRGLHEVFGTAKVAPVVFVGAESRDFFAAAGQS